MNNNDFFLSSLDLCDNLFEVLVSFAESTKRKAAVWPLQIMLLMLSPVSKALASDVTVRDLCHFGWQSNNSLIKVNTLSKQDCGHSSVFLVGFT